MGDIEVVIFDCDGVLFDTTQANRTYYNRILAHLKKPLMTNEQFSYVHMHTVNESMAYLFDDPEALEAAHRFRLGMDYNVFFKYMHMEPGLVSLLHDLRPRYKVAVATNRSDTIQPLLQQFELEAYFDLVVSALDVERPKPFPDQLEKILDFYQVGCRQALYVGDSDVDQRAAHAAGIPLVAFRNASLKADFHIRQLLELKRILGI